MAQQAVVFAGVMRRVFRGWCGRLRTHCCREQQHYPRSPHVCTPTQRHSHQAYHNSQVLLRLPQPRAPIEEWN